MPLGLYHNPQPTSGECPIIGFTHPTMATGPGVQLKGSAWPRAK